MSQPRDIVSVEEILALFEPKELLQQGWTVHHWSLLLATGVLAALVTFPRLRGLAGAPLWPTLLLVWSLEASLETLLCFESGYRGIRWSTAMTWFTVASSGVVLAALLLLCSAITWLQRRRRPVEERGLRLAGLGAVIGLGNVFVNWVFLLFVLTVFALSVASVA